MKTSYRFRRTRSEWIVLAACLGAGPVLAQSSGTPSTTTTPTPVASPRAASTDNNSWNRRWNNQKQWKEVEKQFDNLNWPSAQELFGDPPNPAEPPTPESAEDGSGLAGAEHTADKKLYSFTANGLELKAALALFAQANSLNIVPDNDVTGQVTLSLHDLPLPVVMRALLEANDYTWVEDRGLIRVQSNQTRTFQIDYLQLQRTGSGQNNATLAAGGGGGTSLAGGGGGGGRGGGGGGGGSVGRGRFRGSSINLSAENTVDFWKQLQEDLNRLLTPGARRRWPSIPWRGWFRFRIDPVRSAGSNIISRDSRPQ